jgi:hypothetical protein
MSFGFLSKYFPPEKFLKPAYIGISFSDYNIKAVLFDKDSENPSLKSAIIPLEPKSIVDGKVVNMEEVVEKLSIIKKDFDLPFVFFTVPDELAYIFGASVPVIEGGNATESVAFVIEENVPLTLGEAIFDFTPTKIVQSDSERVASVVVAACVKKEVEKFIEALRKAKFEPLGCIHESQAIAGALLVEKSSEVLCIIHARENRIGIHLVDGGLVIFSTLRSVSDGEYKEQFLDEYRKFLDYCMKYKASQVQPVKSVLVCGEFEYAKKAVEAAIEVDGDTKDVKLANVWTNVLDIDKHQPEIPYERSLSFAGPIGAVLAEVYK